jgi:hypothetical protein
MLALLSSDIAAQMAVILAAALLGWIACLRGQIHRQWIRQPNRAQQLTVLLRSDACISMTTVLGAL